MARGYTRANTEALASDMRSSGINVREPSAIDNPFGYMREGTWKAKIDSVAPPASLRANEENRQKYKIGESDVPGVPRIDLKKFFEDNPNGKLTDVVQAGDAISNSGYGGAYYPYRIIAVAGKSVTVRGVSSSGELVGETVKLNYNVKANGFRKPREGRFNTWVYGSSYYASYND